MIGMLQGEVVLFSFSLHSWPGGWLFLDSMGL